MKEYKWLKIGIIFLIIGVLGLFYDSPIDMLKGAGTGARASYLLYIIYEPFGIVATKFFCFSIFTLFVTIQIIVPRSSTPHQR